MAVRQPSPALPGGISKQVQATCKQPDHHKYTLETAIKTSLSRLAFLNADLQVVSIAADGSLPSFAFQVTARQAASTKLRLDTFLATQITADLASNNEAAAARTQDVSRAKIQASIAAGLVQINGRPATKPSQQLRPGDSVVCSLPTPPPLQALPEAISLDIRYEDDHVIVINKPAGMVVHVAPGHYTGTLVNALLHHCALPALNLDLDPNPGGELHPYFHNHPDMALAPDCGSGDIELAYGDGGDDGDSDGDDDDDTEDDESAFSLSSSNGNQSERNDTHNSKNSKTGNPGDCDVGCSGVVSSRLGGSSSSPRPGIVHRIDKGTSGLLVVAKTEIALTRLQAQFKARTVDRLYESITVGCPAQPRGRVETNIVRDPRDRKRMAAAPYGSGRGRTAGSGYSVAAPLAGGGAALVRWKLDTGRTHQIRVHAKHIGHPLLGDDTYGGTAAAALTVVARNFPADKVRQVVDDLGRPALHAATLTFIHPVTGTRLAFEQPPPEDFRRALLELGLGAEDLSGLDAGSLERL
ncbi:hypothetical protein VaNZ11_001820 [Volvox africanus]|uniref:RNA-binding S4 domain-containing protein n=1 Tax=Volvox africanus TaxID=51714 RepID=A0ABQ5RRG4_9CHLO|nr:hypothetical protein VaNZ11_001820 [Volvox africanus]